MKAKVIVVALLRLLDQSSDVIIDLARSFSEVIAKQLRRTQAGCCCL